MKKIVTRIRLFLLLSKEELDLSVKIADRLLSGVYLLNEREMDLFIKIASITLSPYKSLKTTYPIILERISNGTFRVNGNVLRIP